jgi:hypothetical protein
MGDYIVSRPYIYVAGNVIDPNQNNPNESNIYTAHNAAFHDTTGHTHTGATGDAPKLGATSLNLAGNYAWTGNHSFSTGTFALNNGATLTGTFAGTPTFSGDVTFGSKIKFDTNNYIYLSGANNIDVYTNGLIAFGVNASQNVSFGNNAVLASTKSLNLDGSASGDTYIQESSANLLTISAGGVTSGFTTTALDLNGRLLLMGGAKLHLDGIDAGDTYIFESSANIMALVAAGGTQLTLNGNTATASFGGDIVLASTGRLYFDGGSNDYWVNTANGVNELWAAGTKAMFTDSAGKVTLTSLASSGTATFNGLVNLAFPTQDPPANNEQLCRGQIAKAWVRFTTDAAHNATMVASYNVSSVTYSGADATGWELTFGKAFANANYVMVGATSGDASTAMMLSCNAASNTASVAYVIGTDKNGNAQTGSARSYDCVFFGTIAT